MKKIFLLVIAFIILSTTFSQETPVDLIKVAIELNQQKQYEASLALCNRALELSPELSDAWFLRGFNNYSLENYKDAVNDFSLAIAYRPDYTEAYYYRGKSNQAMGNIRSALGDFRKARDINSSETTLLFLKGIFNSIFGGSSSGS